MLKRRESFFWDLKKEKFVFTENIKKSLNKTLKKNQVKRKEGKNQVKRRLIKELKKTSLGLQEDFQ